MDACAFTLTMFETFFLTIASNAVSLALRTYAHPVREDANGVTIEEERSLRY